MKLKRYPQLIQLLLLFALLAVLSSCRPDKQDKDPSQKLEDSLNVNTEKDEAMKEASKVFYALPSPLETAIIFRNAGAKYNPEILNDYRKVQGYKTTLEMALNLGIYSADLSYTSLFDQTQLSLKYMAAAKELADGLGIIEAFDAEMIRKLEKNVNNKAVVMDIISQAFMNSNISLKQEDRNAIASIVLIGGYIESIYIGTQLSGKNYTQNELVSRIIDQRLPLNSIMSLIEAHKGNKHIQKIYDDIVALKTIFDKISVKTTSITPVQDSNTQVTTLKSRTETTLTDETYKELCNKVEEIRTKFIS